MIAYNTTRLKNVFARQQAAQYFEEGCITREELTGVSNKHPDTFYSPNFFIRIGLFTLTVVILLFSLGLIALLFLNSIENAAGGVAIFFALLSYAALEFMVKEKNHFQSGVDDALLWIFAGAFFGGISYISKADGLTNSVLVLAIATYCSLRFADRLMSAVAYLALLAAFFFFCINMGPGIKAFLPFVIMFVSAIIYFLEKHFRKNITSQLYVDCLQVVSVLTLISFYSAGNYAMVRELRNALFDVDQANPAPVPFGWMFWIFTAAIPCVYLVRGIQKKDIVLVRVGLLLVAAIVFTIRQYYSVAAIESVMTLSGIVLIIVAYGLSRYLKTPKHGFVNVQRLNTEENEKLHLESLLVAQTSVTSSLPVKGLNFGGGNFGGGGASADF